MGKKSLMIPSKQIPSKGGKRGMLVKSGVCVCLLVSLIYVATGVLSTEQQFGYEIFQPALFGNPANSQPKTPRILGFEVVDSYYHDPSAFTQGFLFDQYCTIDPLKPCDEVAWESTGLYGRSSVRLVNLKTGDVLQKTSLPRQYFGEGMARVDRNLYQLTWQKSKGFIYDMNLKQVGEFDTPLSDGWGLTTDGQSLVVSDSTDVLYWLDIKNFQIIKQISVRDGDRPIKWLNELEMIDREIWANVWQTDCIARIDPRTGQVNSWVDLENLTKIAAAKAQKRNRKMDVLNGIAWDVKNREVYVTGKLWPAVYKVKITAGEKRPPTEEELQSIRSKCIPN
ncbi:hypothetical protein BSKO_13457 [Bryopsis sp. KO-2023]|nr:hypothetical protein BSKO_13457 [Bryopsis sp. KO-2023]